MDIYIAIADFNEVRLQRQLQKSIERAMRKGSVKYKEGQHLINLNVINGDMRSSGSQVHRSPLRRRGTHEGEIVNHLSVKDISKSIDSGVCTDARDTEEEESDYEYDEVASVEGDSDSQYPPPSESDIQRSVTPKKTVMRQTSLIQAKCSSPYDIANKSKSLTRRHRNKESTQNYTQFDPTDLMTRSVMGSLAPSWIDSGSDESPVHRAGSKDTLLSLDNTNNGSFSQHKNPCNSPLRKAGSKEGILNGEPSIYRVRSKDGILSSDPALRRVRSKDGILSCDSDRRSAKPESPLSFSSKDGGSWPPAESGNPNTTPKKCPYKSFRPEPSAEGGIASPMHSGSNKGVLLLELKKGDILGVSYSFDVCSQILYMYSAALNYTKLK